MLGWTQGIASITLPQLSSLKKLIHSFDILSHVVFHLSHISLVPRVFKSIPRKSGLRKEKRSLALFNKSYVHTNLTRGRNFHINPPNVSHGTAQPMLPSNTGQCREWSGALKGEGSGLLLQNSFFPLTSISVFTFVPRWRDSFRAWGFRHWKNHKGKCNQTGA